ncbi:embryonic polyadenylate-binding protein-like [Gastrophryne carolinensis]
MSAPASMYMGDMNSNGAMAALVTQPSLYAADPAPEVTMGAMSSLYTEVLNGNGTMAAPASLYVGDLTPEVTEASLYEKFSRVGPVASIRVCRDAATRRSLGYAYVNFVQPADAERALVTLNFETVQGCTMRLMWCQRDPSARKSGVGNVYVRNLEPSIDSKLLRDTFSPFGAILSCKVARNQRGVSLGHGFVHFGSQESADAAIAALDGLLFNERKVYVARYKTREEREQERTRFTNVYVNNLPEDVDERRLCDLFSGFGTPLSIKLMVDAGGRSRGFGFGSFASHEEALAAVAGLNGKEVGGGGHALYAGRAQKKRERQAELRSRFQGSESGPPRNLYVKNLGGAVDGERLREMFAAFGAITSAKVMSDGNGRSKGFGFVCFAGREEAAAALREMNGRIVDGKPLYVARAQRKEERRAMLAAQLSQRRATPCPGPFQPPTNCLVSPFPQQPNRVFYNQSPAHFPQCNAPKSYARISPPGLRSARTNLQLVPQCQYIAQPIQSPAHLQREPAHLQREPAHLQREPAADVHEPLSPASLALLPPQEQKDAIGARLYPVIHSLSPAQSRKITGMLLELENSELLQMLHAPAHLHSRVEEAVSVLRAHNAAEGAVNGSA